MDALTFPSSPGTPLFPVSPERVINPAHFSPVRTAHTSSTSPFKDEATANIAPASSATAAEATPASPSPFVSTPHHTIASSSPTKARHEFGKSTPLIAYTSGSARPITAALAASMAATPTIPPFQLEIAKTPPRSPFAVRGHQQGQHFGARGHARNNSDAMVQGMIARFDGLSVRDWRSQGETAIRRAEMAREMAEMECERLRKQMGDEEEERGRTREEGRRLKKEVEDGKERERKMARRLEVVMDELNRAKDTHGHTVTVYEKEVRKTRKDALKSASALIKAQEEAKASRAQFKAAQTNLDTERQKAAKHEQEAFTAQYQLVGMQEELQRALERCKVIEQERDALKTSLKEEEVLRVAAEGRIALPPAQDDDEEQDLLLLSPRKSPAKSPAKSPRKMPRRAAADSDSEKENSQPIPRQGHLQLKALQEELTLERRQRQRAIEQIEFMKMECQFQSCSCRLAEQRGKKYVHDASFVVEMESIRNSRPTTTTQAADHDNMQVDYVDAVEAHDFASLHTATEQQHRTIADAQYEDAGVDSMPTQQNTLASEAPDEVLIEQPLRSRPKQAKRVSLMSARRSARRESMLQATLQETAEDASGITTNVQELAPIYSVAGDLEDHELEVASRTAPTAAVDEIESEEANSTPVSQSPMAELDEPRTPAGVAVRTITTTTTIPMQFSPVKQPQSHQHLSSYTPSFITHAPTTPRTIAHPPYGQLHHTGMHLTNDENLPPPASGVLKPDGTIDREAALEMIRQRRSRATSLKVGEATPRRQMVQGAVRRDVSAPHHG